MIYIQEYIEMQLVLINKSKNKNVKLEILHSIKTALLLGKQGTIYIYHMGLCDILKVFISGCKALSYSSLRLNFPDFTNENAVKYCNARKKPETSLWWEIYEKYDFDNRINFIDFLISKL